MKCPNCNSELPEGAKFCTGCGTPAATAQAASVCRSCGATLPPAAKFCTTCGTPAAAPAPESAPERSAEGGQMSVVKQKICWNIRKGEVACRLNEAEFTRYDRVQGLIVNDGTTAYVKADGKILAEIHGGIYDFVEPEELQRMLESRHGGLAGMVTGCGRFLVNAVLGRRVKDNLREENRPEKQRTLDALIESMKRHEVFSLQLKLDKSFSLVFGSGTAEETAEFRPMVVRTKLLDMQVGVRAVFRIADFDRFSEHFLVDVGVATTRRIAEMLQPAVQSAVQHVMQDREIGQSTIPADIAEEIAARIAAAGEGFHGLALEQVAEVVASNEDLERLRSLSRELYLSEQELDYLRRTNDFRNRLAAETNAQEIADARSEQQLYAGLQEVNRDRLLTDDELDKFYTVLSREKRIRDARSEAEVEEAMAEIARTGLLREEDIANLRADIAERGYRRGQSLRLMQLRDEIEFEKVRTAGEGEIAVEAMRRNLELQEMTITQRRMDDAYSDERRAREREQRLADRKAEFEADDAEMNAQIERLRKIREMKREDRRMELEHEIALERTRQEALDKQAQMSAEQIMAIGAREHLDAEGARAYAESFAAGRDAEQARRDAEARIADSRRHEEMMLEMMRQMQQTTVALSGNLIRHKDEEREEYRQRLEKQEDRMERTQDRALDYTTRNNQQAAAPQPAQQQIGRVCPDCGTVVQPGIRFCANCGREIN